jgi:hypothetical protein
LHEKFIEILKIEKTENEFGKLPMKYVCPEDTRIETNLWMVQFDLFNI